MSLLGSWYPLRSKSKTVLGPFLWRQLSPQPSTWSAHRRNQVDIKFHSQNPGAPQVPEGAVQCGEAASSWPQSSRSSRCALLVCLFIRGIKSAPQGMPFHLCAPSHSRAGWGASKEASASFAFWPLNFLMFWLFSVTVSYSSWGNQFSLLEERNWDSGASWWESISMDNGQKPRPPRKYSPTQWEDPLLWAGSDPSLKTLVQQPGNGLSS